MYITNNSDVALIAEKYGVDRIWIDLETLGKEERQHNMNTVKSKHSIEDIKRIKPLLTKSDMLVRINPWNDNSEKEINDVIAAGADMIMLPMWKSAKEAAECLDEVLANGGMDEIHIGLNDLHLSYGMTFMFELLADGTVERLTKKIKAKGLPCGFGGIARLGEGDLPAERVIMEHYRLGSTRAILSRSFCNTDMTTDIEEIENIFKKNMKDLRNFEIQMDKETEFEKNHEEVKRIVQKIVEAKKGNK